MIYVPSTSQFNGHVCFIGQYAPFNNANYLQVIAALEFIFQKYQINDPLILNFFMGSSQFMNFKCEDLNFVIPIEVRYEIMVNNALELSDRFNCIPSGLYHVADFDSHHEWACNILQRITKGSIIISNENSQIYNQIEKYSGGTYNHLVFESKDYNHRTNCNFIRKLLIAGDHEYAKQFLPNKTIEIMQKHGLIDKNHF
jgi:hypothetical protein